MARSVLVTGGTGFLGGQIMARHLEAGDRHVYALVRAASDEEATRRIREAIAAIYGSEDAHAERLTAVAGDIELPGLGLERARLEQLAGEITEVVHAAATVSFSLPLETARQINLEGTRHMLEFGALCEQNGGLRHFSYVSTTYVAGAYDGHFRERDLDVGQRFRNSYERSKFEAERLVREWGASLPVRIFRPAIIVGESASGWTSAFNVLYYPVRIFAKGVNPPIVPARGATPLDVVPVDFVADTIFRLGERDGPSGEVVHIVCGDDASSVREVLKTAARYFGRRVPVLIPLRLYVYTLEPLVRRMYRGNRRRQLDKTVEFLPYFSMRQTFERSHEPTAAEPPPLRTYFERLFEFAVVTDWGRRPMSRDEARSKLGTQRSATNVPS